MYFLPSLVPCALAFPLRRLTWGAAFASRSAFWSPNGTRGERKHEFSSPRRPPYLTVRSDAHPTIPHARSIQPANPPRHRPLGLARRRRLVRGLARGVPCAESVGGENGTLACPFPTPCLFLPSPPWPSPSPLMCIPTVYVCMY